MISALEQLVGNMTIAQLAAARGMTVTELGALVLEAGSPRGETPKPTASSRPKAKPKAKESPEAGTANSTETNTRTRAGREALDESIVDFLKSQSEPVRAVDIRNGIGGTAAQIRTRLNVLIEQGRVNYKGRASGTRYRIAEAAAAA